MRVAVGFAALAAVSMAFGQEGSGTGGKVLNAEVIAILTMVEQNRMTLPDASSALQALPIEASVDTLVWEIENGPRREVAWRLLLGLRASTTQAGFDMLLRGLRDDDWGKRLDCSRALGGSPEERSGAAGVALGNALLTETDPRVRDGIVGALDTLPPRDAVPYTDELKKVFGDTNLAVGSRSRAAHALLRIAGTLPAIALFRGTDPAGGHAALSALVLLGAETGASVATDDHGREVVRDFVLSFAEVQGGWREQERQVMTELLPFLIGPDPSSKDPGQLTINRRILGVAESMLREEPAEGLRNNLNRLLAAFDKNGMLTYRPKSGRKP